ncbi:MAG: ATP-binding protein [Candidatus Odinarchaeota archaeon]
MNLWILHLFFVSFLTMIVGFYIYSINPRNELHKSFLVACLLVSYYSLTEFAMQLTSDISLAQFFSKMAFIWPFILVALLQFIVIFAEKSAWLKKKLFRVLVYGSAAIQSFLHLISDEISGILMKTSFGWTYYAPLTPLALVSSIMIYAYVSAGIIVSYSFYRNTQDVLKKKQAEWLLFGIISGTVLMTITQLVVPVFTLIVPDPTSSIFLILCVFIGYATWRYQFFELTPEFALDKILSTMKNLMVLTDNKGDIKAVNPATLDLLNYKEEYLLGRSVSSILPNSDSFQTKTPGIIAVDFLYECLNRNVEVFLKDKDGREVPVLLTVSRLGDRHRPAGFVCIGADMTLSKQMEKKLEEKEELDQLQRQFISNASHELRTPITSLAQAVSILEKHGDKVTEQQQTSLLAIISRNIKLLAVLVDDLLVLSRLDGKKIQIKWETYQLADILQETAMQLEPLFKTSNVLLALNLGDDSKLTGGRKQISQIIRILLDNALKYSDPGTTVQAKIMQYNKGKYNTQGKEGMLLQVIDAGRGIRESDIAHLFDRFFRSADVRDIPGTGLGLSIARELVQLHHGEIFVESTYGKGSTFTVFLPFLDPNFPLEV